MICGLRESVCCMCSNGRMLGQQDLLRKIYHFRSLLVYLHSHDLRTEPAVKEKGVSTPLTCIWHIFSTSSKWWNDEWCILNADYNIKNWLILYFKAFRIFYYVAKIEAMIILSLEENKQWCTITRGSNMKFTVTRWFSGPLHRVQERFIQGSS